MFRISDQFWKFSLLSNIKFCRKQSFVPSHCPLNAQDVIKLKTFINDTHPLILSGAGISTESGIPDYRSENTGLYATSKHRPIIYSEFLNNERARRRYWARNFVGWPKFSSFKPNINHYVLKKLQVQNKINWIITQNVDNLLQKADCRNVIELHGTSYRVRCIRCSYSIDRHIFQKSLENMNCSSISETNIGRINPDGDVEVNEDIVKNFKVPDCEFCKGLLKPDIVFFGDNVPSDRVKFIQNLVQISNSLLILGSSLSVFSSYRIVLQAFQEKKPIMLINIGPTRADDLPITIINVKCGDIMCKLV